MWNLKDVVGLTRSGLVVTWSVCRRKGTMDRDPRLLLSILTPSSDLVSWKREGALQGLGFRSGSVTSSQSPNYVSLLRS